MIIFLNINTFYFKKIENKIWSLFVSQANVSWFKSVYVFLLESRQNMSQKIIFWSENICHTWNRSSSREYCIVGYSILLSCILHFGKCGYSVSHITYWRSSEQAGMQTQSMSFKHVNKAHYRINALFKMYTIVGNKYVQLDLTLTTHEPIIHVCISVHRMRLWSMPSH